jgi:hypothetical protein
MMTINFMLLMFVPDSTVGQVRERTGVGHPVLCGFYLHSFVGICILTRERNQDQSDTCDPNSYLGRRF